MKEPSRIRNSFLNLITGLIWQVLRIILKFATRTVFVYVLGKEYLGIGGLFSNILNLFALTELGMGGVLTYKLYKPIAENNEKRIRLLIHFYRRVFHLIGVTILVMGLLLIPGLPYLIKDYDTLIILNIDATTIYLLYLFQSASTYFFFSHRTIIISAAQKSYYTNVTGCLFELITNLLQISVLLVWHNFIGYLIVVITINIFRNITNAVVARKLFPFVFTKDEMCISKAEIKDIFKDCISLFGFKANTIVIKASDNIILSYYIGLVIVGVYANYLLLYVTIKEILGQVVKAVKASMGAIYATESINERYHTFEVMNFSLLILYGTAGLGLALVGNDFIELWIGKDYVIPYPFPFLLGIELVIHGIKLSLSQIREISGLFRQMWYRPIFSIIINLGVSLWLVQDYGVMGVVMGTIIADVLTDLFIDPIIIHRYAFANSKPLSKYIKKNICYIILLSINSYIVFSLYYSFFDTSIVRIIIGVIMCLFLVPATFFIIFKESFERRILENILNNLIFTNEWFTNIKRLQSK